MTLARNNLQRPITGLQMIPPGAEPVRRVAHLSGVPLRAPYPNVVTACPLRKRPSRTQPVSAIAMPNINFSVFNTMNIWESTIDYKKRRARHFQLQIMEDLLMLSSHFADRTPLQVVNAE